MNYYVKLETSGKKVILKGDSVHELIADLTALAGPKVSPSKELVFHSYSREALVQGCTPKVAAIKAVRVVTGKGLKDAKDLVEAEVSAVLLRSDSDEKLKDGLDCLLEAGCKAEIRPVSRVLVRSAT